MVRAEPFRHTRCRRVGASTASVHATIRRYHYADHDQLRAHLRDFLDAYNFARRLKTLGGLTAYEFVCKLWASEPQRFRLDPTHQMPGLNT